MADVDPAVPVDASNQGLDSELRHRLVNLSFARPFEKTFNFNIIPRLLLAAQKNVSLVSLAKKDSLAPSPQSEPLS
ncbi:uncharacterized protein TrAtP1_008783 [Trichoderma atroviride]|uniref:uncharacterized protein n=1 Tax=Hypocrea atroviridis TaxID=63577 RepID=UPI00331BF984|nr:hypothetical protein TrAtP1_008783 [Trichoderma atroviride]